MPYVVLEAIAAGLPLIATRVGGIPEIFGAESGRLVAPGETGELANAMAAMLAAPEAAQAAAERLKAQIRATFTVAQHGRGDRGGLRRRKGALRINRGQPDFSRPNKRLLAAIL